MLALKDPLRSQAKLMCMVTIVCGLGGMGAGVRVKSSSGMGEDGLFSHTWFHLLVNVKDRGQASHIWRRNTSCLGGLGPAHTNTTHTSFIQNSSQDLSGAIHTCARQMRSPCDRRIGSLMYLSPDHNIKYYITQYR